MLNELRENVSKNVKCYLDGEFMSVYCAYLHSMFFALDISSGNYQSSEQEKFQTLSNDFSGLHKEFVDDLKYRRLS